MDASPDKVVSRGALSPRDSKPVCNRVTRNKFLDYARNKSLDFARDKLGWKDLFIPSPPQRGSRKTRLKQYLKRRLKPAATGFFLHNP